MAPFCSKPCNPSTSLEIKHTFLTVPTGPFMIWHLPVSDHVFYILPQSFLLIALQIPRVPSVPQTCLEASCLRGLNLLFHFFRRLLPLLITYFTLPFHLSKRLFFLEKLSLKNPPCFILFRAFYHLKHYIVICLFVYCQCCQKIRSTRSGILPGFAFCSVSKAQPVTDT